MAFIVTSRPGEPLECNEAEPIDTVCGISRIWVIKKHKRTGIARQMLDAVRYDILIRRRHFLFGIVLLPEQLAFSQPTTDGQALARAYSGMNFCIYMD